MGQNGQSGKNIETRYMFYDKTKEKNNGWVWWHHTLSPDIAYNLLRLKLQPEIGNGDPDGKGFITDGNQKIFYQYFSRDKDERNRKHWVLLLAWPAASMESREIWSIFDDEVFKHIGSEKDDIPEVLSVFDYDPCYCKLVHSGGKESVEPGKNARELVEKAESFGKVDVVFYCEQSDGYTKIITEPKPHKV